MPVRPGWRYTAPGVGIIGPPSTRYEIDTTDWPASAGDYQPVAAQIILANEGLIQSWVQGQRHNTALSVGGSRRNSAQFQGVQLRLDSDGKMETLTIRVHPAAYLAGGKPVLPQLQTPGTAPVATVVITTNAGQIYYANAPDKWGEADIPPALGTSSDLQFISTGSQITLLDYSALMGAADNLANASTGVSDTSVSGALALGAQVLADTAVGLPNTYQSFGGVFWLTTSGPSYVANAFSPKKWVTATKQPASGTGYFSAGNPVFAQFIETGPGVDVGNNVLRFTDPGGSYFDVTSVGGYPGFQFGKGKNYATFSHALISWVEEWGLWVLAFNKPDPLIWTSSVLTGFEDRTEAGGVLTVDHLYYYPGPILIFTSKDGSSWTQQYQGSYTNGTFAPTFSPGEIINSYVDTGQIFLGYNLVGTGPPGTLPPGFYATTSLVVGVGQEAVPVYQTVTNTLYTVSGSDTITTSDMAVRNIAVSGGLLMPIPPN